MLLKRGDNSDQVKFAQELLSLTGLKTTPDGDFGPATEEIIRIFQGSHGLDPSGQVDQDLYDLMERIAGISEIKNPPATVLMPTLSGTVAQLALWHARFEPKEVGGDNRGPWVRLYMNDTEGLPWCAGFVTYIVKQAQKLTGLRAPITGGWACTRIAEQALASGAFRRGEELADIDIPAGSIFIRRKKGHDNAWEHTGIVTADIRQKGIVRTIEGNTNDNGSREGFEVCTHILRRDNRDYIFV